MTDNAQDYIIPNIRKLLTNAFMDTGELRRFCRDRTDFEPVLRLASEGAGMDEHVDKLIAYCDTRFMMDELLAEVRKQNSRQYDRFEPYIVLTDEPDGSGDGERLKPPPPPPFQWIRELLKAIRGDRQLIVLAVVALFLVVGILLLAFLPQLVTSRTNTPTPTATDIATPTATDVSNPTSTPTPTATDTDTPSPTATDTDTPSPTPTATSSPRVTLESELNNCGPWLVSSNVDLQRDPLDAAVQLYAIEPHSQSVGPFRDGFVLTLYVTSASQNTEWIELANTAVVSVQVYDNAEESVDFWRVKRCGGMGFVRAFEEGELTADHETYTFSITDSEADFFTLQPGEFEGFLFPLKCGEPGTYRVRVELPYKYKGESGTIVFPDARPLVCPKSYSLWEAYAPGPGGTPGPLEHAGDFEWNGTGYQSTR